MKSKTPEPTGEYTLDEVIEMLQYARSMIGHGRAIVCVSDKFGVPMEIEEVKADMVDGPRHVEIKVGAEVKEDD